MLGLAPWYGDVSLQSLWTIIGMHFAAQVGLPLRSVSRRLALSLLLAISPDMTTPAPQFRSEQQAVSDLFGLSPARRASRLVHHHQIAQLAQACRELGGPSPVAAHGTTLAVRSYAMGCSGVTTNAKR